MRRGKWIFYFLFWTAVRAREEPLYKEIGDNVVLTPDSEENPIINIRWMYGNDIAMWYRYGGEPLFFRQFKDRGSLDISTGVMTIKGLTPDDSGIYTAEINGKETSKTELQVISPVPKPNIYVLCDPEKTYCVLTCDGNTTGTEPVTYWWTAGEKRWNSTKELKITKEDKEQWFICELENPVGSSSSEKVFNPFRKSDQTRMSFLTPLVLMILVLFILFFMLIIIVTHKYINGRAANRELKERGIMLSGVRNKSIMKPHVVGHSYSKGAGLKPQWQYGRRSGGWWDFRETTDPPNGCSVTNDEVERRYQEKPLHKMPFKVNEDIYELDFKEMTLTHLKTKTKRKVRRVMLPPECQDVGVSCSDSPLLVHFTEATLTASR